MLALLVDETSSSTYSSFDFPLAAAYDDGLVPVLYETETTFSLRGLPNSPPLKPHTTANDATDAKSSPPRRAETAP